MLLALCYKNSGLFFNLKKNSQTRMVETRVTQAFISTHKASVAIRISALTCCISCHSRCLEASRPTRRGHLDSKLERREYFTLLSKRTSMNFRILRKNLDQGSVIIFYQWKLFWLIDLIPGLLYEVKPGIQSIKNINFHWSKIIIEPYSRFFHKIQ